MTVAERKKITYCLLIIAALLLCLCWYLRERTDLFCTVENVGTFRFTVQPSIYEPVCWGGASDKRIYWTKSDGSEVCYRLGSPDGGYYESAFVLVERLNGERGLLLDGGSQKAFLSFSGILYGNYYLVDNKGRLTGTPDNSLPNDFKMEPRRQLAQGGRPMIDSALALAFMLLWPFMLVAVAICVLWLIGIDITTRYLRRCPAAEFQQPAGQRREGGGK